MGSDPKSTVEAAASITAFSTLLAFQYGMDERSEVPKVIRAITSAAGPGWSSSGVYVFWDPKSKRVLYVGKATDLATRIADHNGLHAGSGAASKWGRVKGLIDSRGSAGLTLVMAPPEIRRAEKTAQARYRVRVGRIVPVADPIRATFESDIVRFSAAANFAIAAVESALIRRYADNGNLWPEWNDAEGAMWGRDLAASLPIAPWVVRLRARAEPLDAEFGRRSWHPTSASTQTLSSSSSTSCPEFDRTWQFINCSLVARATVSSLRRAADALATAPGTHADCEVPLLADEWRGAAAQKSMRRPHDFDHAREGVTWRERSLTLADAGEADLLDAVLRRG